MSVQNGKVVLEPMRDLLDLGGVLKTAKKPLSGVALHEFVVREVGKAYKDPLK